jgi:MFS family permease
MLHSRITLTDVADLRFKIIFVALTGIGFGAVWPVYAAAAMDFFPKSRNYFC